MKFKILLVCGALVIALSGWGFFYKESRANQSAGVVQVIQSGFVQQYGINAKMLQPPIKPQEQWLILWEDPEYRHASLWIDGIWTEIARVPLAKTPKE